MSRSSSAAPPAIASIPAAGSRHRRRTRCRADVARRLLAAASDALPPGGQLIICEEFRNPDRLAVQFFWTYFLIGVDACVSRLREVEWYTQALAELEFGEVAIVSGAFDVIVATRR